MDTQVPMATMMKKVLDRADLFRREHVAVFVATLMIGVSISASDVMSQQMDVPGKPGAQQPYSARVDASSLSRAGASTFVSEDVAQLRLAPGFLVALSVLDEPDLNGTFRVDQQGNVQLPAIGAVPVSGQTASEASGFIRQKLLAAEILKDPQVTLNVVEYTAPQVTIVGEVVSPGKYPLLARIHWSTSLH
jgi:protein involved in polysaccharide export with SLBB domain